MLFQEDRGLNRNRFDLTVGARLGIDNDLELRAVGIGQFYRVILRMDYRARPAVQSGKPARRKRHLHYATSQPTCCHD